MRNNLRIVAEVYAAHNVFFNRKFQVMVFFEVEGTGGHKP